MKKNYFSFITIILSGLIVSNCSKMEEEFAVQNESKLQETIPTTRSMGDGKYQVLGYGYDITGEYLERKSIKLQVLDIDSFVKNNAGTFKPESINTINDYTYFGDNFMNYVKEVIRKSEFSGSVAEKISKADTESGEIPYAFSASYNGESTKKKSITTKETYIKVDQTKHLEQLRLLAEPDILSNYLTPYFKTKLNTATPDDVVKEFGTHILLDFIVGGRLSVYFTSTITDNLNSESKTNIAKAGASYALNKVGLSFSGSSSTQEIETYQRKNTNWSCQIVTNGGQHNGHTATISSEGVVNQTINYSEWQKSVDKSHCVLTEINFDKTHPIYEFIKDPVKKQQIKDAVIRYINNQKKPILKLKPMFQLKSRNTGDTWWVYSKDEVDYAVNRWGEEFQGLLGFVLAEPDPDARPMYRLKSRRTSDTWYTFDWGTVQYAIAKWNEEYSGIDGYLYVNSHENTRPLYRLKSRRTSDTWYTCDWGTVQYAMDKWKEEYSGVDGYVINP